MGWSESPSRLTAGIRPAHPFSDSSEHGALQSERYRSADPREVVEDDGVVMSGPGGTPEEGKSVEERRRESGDRQAGP